VDFFGQQERARAISKRLVFLFALAVALTNLAVYLAVAGSLRLTYLLAGPASDPGSRQVWLFVLADHFCSEGVWSWELLGWVLLALTPVLAVGAGYKLWQLSAGGAVVARLLGGRPVGPNTADPSERTLLHVVEEMAIASGLPVPDVYLLEEERGINAFTAGNEPSDAVIGVTFGALKLLSRDQLQGVVAHEFSHILNGDMRLNTRLIGWLHGILGLVVLGRILRLDFMPRLGNGTSPREDRKARFGPIFHPAFLAAFILGSICLVAGSFGAFFARLIKSAVSRQREYLADAAAVQFTRHPAAVAGALVKIGGVSGLAEIGAARAEEASHMYFGDGMKRRWFGFLSTHPPLTKRIRRIVPEFDGKYPAVSLARVLRESKVTAEYREHAGAKPVDFAKVASVIGPAAAAQEMLYAKAAEASARRPAAPAPETILHTVGFSPAHLEYAALFLGMIPESVRAATRQAASAVALVYGMICSQDPETRARQIAGIAEGTEPEIISELTRLLPWLDKLDAGAFLPLADLSLRALRQLSAEQHETLCRNLQRLVEADQQIDLFEYMLQRMIVRHLDPYFRPVKGLPVQYYALKPLVPECAILLSGLARIGQDSEAAAQAAFENGAAQLMPDPNLRFLPLAECNLLQIDGALDKTAQASLQLKRQILNALACVAATDGQLRKREAELLRAIADAFGTPIPPFLCTA